MWIRFDEKTPTQITRIVEVLRAAGFDDEATRIEEEAVNVLTEERAALIAEAKDCYAREGDEEIDVDPDAAVSVGDEGTFVMAWVYVPTGDSNSDSVANKLSKGDYFIVGPSSANIPEDCLHQIMIATANGFVSDLYFADSYTEVASFGSLPEAVSAVKKLTTKITVPLI